MKKLIYLTPGLYRHYKGKYYQVLDTAINSETLAKMVVYKALYHSEDFGPCATWVRPYTMFTSMVEVDGEEVPRFEYVGEI
jgi:hypothetical protein